MTFWDVTPHSSVDRYQRVGSTYTPIFRVLYIFSQYMEMEASDSATPVVLINQRTMRHITEDCNRLQQTGNDTRTRHRFPPASAKRVSHTAPSHFPSIWQIANKYSRTPLIRKLVIRIGLALWVNLLRILQLALKLPVNGSSAVQCYE